jgi:undecaprenyl-diphosphatase
MGTLILAVLIGIIEGVTEFLPVSSTGHLLLFQQFIGKQQSELFNVIIQVAAVMAVIPLFWNRIVSMFIWRDKESKDMFIKTSVAFVATGFLGLVFKKLGLELPDNSMPIALALLIGGVAFIVVESRKSIGEGTNFISWQIVAVAVLGQVIAMVFPGASRSGSTIILMLIVGLSRGAATEFSFLIGIPTMIAAGGYEILDAVISKSTMSEDIFFLIASSLFSAITAFISVKWLLGYIKNNSFVGFGIYRIVLSLVIFASITLNYIN